MSRYRKIEVRTWSDEKFRELSAIPPSGQGLWFFLLTGPHTTAIPGLFRAGRAAMAEELNWEQEAFDEAFREVSDQGMAKADFKAKLVWLPKAIQHNKPESPNVVRGWRVELDLLPECDLKREAVEGIREALEIAGPSYVEAFDEVLSTKKKEPVKPSAKPSAKGMPNQEQEQEQEVNTSCAPKPSFAANDQTGDNCPHQQIVGLYHQHLPSAIRVREWTPARAQALRARWREKPQRQNLEWWERFFGYIAESDFLMGRAHSNGRKPFEIDLEWICKSKNFVKIIEGKFHEAKEVAA